MHIAQVNVARALEPLDAPLLRDFVAALAPVNALADAAPGFVWRLQTDDGDATSVRIDPDPRVIVNLSVWTSLEALWAFVYGSAHVGVMQRRRTWFERPVESHLAMWWVPAGATPGVDEAMQRLAAAPAPWPDAEGVRLQASVCAGRRAGGSGGAAHPPGRLRLSEAPGRGCAAAARVGRSRKDVRLVTARSRRVRPPGQLHAPRRDALVRDPAHPGARALLAADREGRGRVARRDGGARVRPRHGRRPDPDGREREPPAAARPRSRWSGSCSPARRPAVAR